MFSCDHSCDHHVTNPTFSKAADAAIRIVTLRLEQAGRTMLSLPEGGYRPGMKTGGLDFVRAAVEAYGWTDECLRPAAPSCRAITEMDEAYGWLALIPEDRPTVRRVVSARTLVSPLDGRHIYPWRRLAKVIQSHHTQVQRWHAEGIRDIVAGLHHQSFFK